MPVKKTAAAPKPDTIARLADALAALVKSRESFQDTVNSYNSITEDTVGQLRRDLEVAREEYEATVVKNQQELQRQKIAADLELEEHQVQGAISLLNGKQYTCVRAEEYQQLKRERDEAVGVLESTRTDLVAAHAREVEELTKKHRADLATAMNSLKQQKELEHKAAVAALEAGATQAQKEVGVLKQTIQELRDDVQAQRALTQSVAEASKQGAISQSFGKA